MTRDHALPNLSWGYHKQSEEGKRAGEISSRQRDGWVTLDVLTGVLAWRPELRQRVASARIWRPSLATDDLLDGAAHQERRSS